MDILSTITGVFNTVVGFINSGHKSEEEKLKIQNELVALQINLASQAMDLQKQILTAQAEIIKTEASQGSWMQRNWRPMTMLTFLILIILDSLNILPNRLSPDMWNLLELGMGGYVIGRSVEKIAPSIIEKIK